MSAARSFAVATRLTDGRVLVVAGDAAESAELYDPSKGRFSPTGASLIQISDNDPTATLLPDGEVLVTGTTRSGPAAEIYDPKAGEFKGISYALAPGAAASAQYSGQPVERTAPQTATLLGDGRVLLFESGYLEVFDPAAGTFAPAGFMAAPGQWFFPSATLLGDGQVLCIGSISATSPDPAGLYNPATGPHSITSMLAGRAFETTTLLPDGSVLIAGGAADWANATSSAELFK